MSFEFTRKHLKADLTKRTIIDESLGQTQEEHQQRSHSPTENQSKRQRLTNRPNKDAATTRPVAKKYNPYVNAVDGGRGSARAIQKQLKLASSSLDQNASEVLFDPTLQLQTKKKRGAIAKLGAERGLSTKAMLNLQFLSRTEDPEAKAKKAETRYADRIKASGANKKKK